MNDITNAATINQLLDRNLQALNDQDIEAVLANQRDDARLEVGGQFTIEGHDQLAAYTQALWVAFPEGTFNHRSRLIVDDSAVAEMVFTGTHSGPLSTPAGDIPPTGRQVTVYSVSVMQFRAGLITSEHAYSDQLHFMSQLGLLPGRS